jgi:hypothetical protein
LTKLDVILLEVRDYIGFPRPDLPEFLAFGEAIERQIVPEPSTWGALLLGCGTIALRLRRYR